MTKKERRERAQQKIDSYMNSILDTIEDVAHSNKYDTGQELLDAAIREANIKINALIKENPQEKNLIEQAAYKINDKLKSMF